MKTRSIIDPSTGETRIEVWDDELREVGEVGVAEDGTPIVIVEGGWRPPNKWELYRLKHAYSVLNSMS